MCKAVDWLSKFRNLNRRCLVKFITGAMASSWILQRRKIKRGKGRHDALMLRGDGDGA
jgi:hypothetical protein